MFRWGKIICATALIWASCKKDPLVPVNGNGGNACENFSFSNINFVNWPGFDTVYNTPSYNPNDDNEIMYIQGITSTGKTSLVKKNLLTKQEVTIFTGALFNGFDWSKRDWVLFNHGDNQIWKIKSNGDSLTLLTTDLKGGHNAVWNSDGTKLAFTREVGNSKYNIIMDLTGNYLDTLPYFSFYLTKWSSNDKYVAGLTLDQFNVSYVDVVSKQTFTATNNQPAQDYKNKIFLDGATWTPDSQYLIWCTKEGIYKTEISANKTIKIKNTCDSKYFTKLSVSSNGQKIIAQRVDQKLTDNSLYIKQGLSSFSVDGSNEINIAN